MTLTENASVVTNDTQGPQVEISTPQEIAIGIHCHAQRGNKTTPVYYSAEEKALGCYFQV